MKPVIFPLIRMRGLWIYVLLNFILLGSSFIADEPAVINKHSNMVAHYLETTSFTGSELVNFLEMEYPPLRELYNGSAQVWEGYTVKEHTLMVLEQFEKQISCFDFSENTKKFLKILLALHDIGKSLGPVEKQHEYTLPILKQYLELWGFDLQIVKLGCLLINNDIIGHLAQNNNNMTPEIAYNQLLSNAQEAGISLKSYFDLQLCIYSCDASSYQTVRTYSLILNNQGIFVPKQSSYRCLLELIGQHQA